jgi:hypothetical protein
MKHIESFKNRMLKENVDNTDLKEGDVVEVVSIFGRGKDELNDIEKKYIGKLYIIDDVYKCLYEDDDHVTILGGGTWDLNDIRKISDEEKIQRKNEIDKIYSDHENDLIYSSNLNKEYLKNHINSFMEYLKGKEFDLDENIFDLSNDKYEIKLSITKR